MTTSFADRDKVGTAQETESRQARSSSPPFSDSDDEEEDGVGDISGGARPDRKGRKQEDEDAFSSEPDASDEEKRPPTLLDAVDDVSNASGERKEKDDERGNDSENENGKEETRISLNALTDLEVDEGDRVDVVIDEVDPLAYHPRQVEGMLLSLLNRNAPLYTLRRNAADFMYMLQEQYLKHAVETGRTDVLLLRHQPGSGGAKSRAQHAVTAQNARVRVPATQLRYKTGEVGDFLNAVHRIAEEKRTTDQEADAELWKLWYPYEERDGGTQQPAFQEDEEANQGAPSRRRSRRRVFLLEGDQSKAVALGEDVAAGDQNSDGRALSRRQHCTNIHLIGPLSRDYMSDDTGEIVHTLVYAGDAPVQTGELLLGDPYGFMKVDRMTFDAEEYRSVLSSLKPGDAVLAFPPGDVTIRHGLPRGVSCAASVLRRNQSKETNGDGDRIVPIMVAHPAVLVEVDTSSAATATETGWFFYPKDKAHAADDAKLDVPTPGRDGKLTSTSKKERRRPGKNKTGGKAGDDHAVFGVPASGQYLSKTGAVWDTYDVLIGETKESTTAQRSDDSLFPSVGLHLMLGVLDRVARLPEETRRAIVNYGQVEKMIKRSFVMNDEATFEEGQASVLRGLIEDNVERMTAPPSSSSQAAAASPSSRSAKRPRARPQAYEKDGDVRTAENKNNKKRKKQTAGGDAATTASTPAPHVRLAKKNETDDELPHRAYRMPFFAVDYDADTNRSTNVPLFFHGQTTDRGYLQLLIRLRRALEPLAGGRGQGNRKSAGTDQKKGGGERRSDYYEGRGGETREGAGGETRESESDGQPESCRKAATLFSKCSTATLQEMALKGFHVPGSPSNAVASANADNVKNGSRCSRVADAGSEAYTAFMFSPLKVGPFGRGFVVDKLIQTSSDCIADARRQRLARLAREVRAAQERRQGVDVDRVLSELDGEIARVARDVWQRRSLPLHVWPPFEPPTQASRAYGSQALDVEPVYISRLADEPQLVLTYEDKGHYAPLTQPLRGDTESQKLEAADKGADDDYSSVDSFLSVYIRGKGDNTVAQSALGHVAEAADAMDVVAGKRPPTDLDGAVEEPDNDNGMLSSSSSTPARIDARLDALAKLRNPPERVAYSIQRQVAVLRSRKQQVMQRLSKASASKSQGDKEKEYRRVEAKMIDKIVRDARTEQRRKEFVTAGALVYVATQSQRPPTERLSVEDVTASVNDVMNTLVVADSAEAKETTSKPSRPVDPRELREEIDVIAPLYEASSASSTTTSRSGGELASTPDGTTVSSRKDTAVWPGFRPFVPSDDAENVDEALPLSLANTPAAEFVLKLDRYIEEERRKSDVATADGKKQKEPKQRVSRASAIEKKAQRLYASKSNAKKVLSSCCVTRVTDDIDYYLSYYDRSFLQAGFAVVDRLRLRDREARREDSIARPLILRRIETDAFISYPDNVDFKVAANNMELVEKGRAASTSSRRSTLSYETAPEDAVASASTLRRFVRANPGFASDSLFAGLMAALTSKNKATAEREASSMLSSARQMWSLLTERSDAGQAGAEEVANAVFDTTRGSIDHQRESASILASYINSELNAGLYFVSTPIPNDAALSSTSATSSAIEKKQPHFQRAHAETLAIRDSVARIEPAQVHDSFVDLLREALRRHTRDARLLNVAFFSEDTVQPWAACAVQAYVVCTTLAYVFRAAQNAPATQSIAGRLVAAQTHALSAMYKLSHASVRFDALISEQREAEKRKIIDLYESMTQEERDSLNLYKKIADFDERRLPDFLADRRKGFAASASAEDGDVSEEGGQEGKETEAADVADVATAEWDDERMLPERIDMDNEQGYMVDDDNEDTEYERDTE